jgi:predicted RNase H-like HicB family nuclease
MAAMKSYTVRYQQDKAGYWVATVEGIQGCHTQGRSVGAARTRVLEAMDVCGVDPRRVEIDEVFDLKRKPALALARKAMAARERAEKAQDEAQELLRAAVRELLQADLSHRDAAAVLGISHQRVAQLVRHKKKG